MLIWKQKCTLIQNRSRSGSFTTISLLILVSLIDSLSIGARFTICQTISGTRKLVLPDCHKLSLWAPLDAKIIFFVRLPRSSSQSSGPAKAAAVAFQLEICSWLL